MRAYVNAKYDRTAALAYLNSPAGQREIHRDLLEKTDHLFAIPRLVGDLIQSLTMHEEPPATVKLFAAIGQGADLSRVTTHFCHWFLANKVPPPPSDYPGLREFLEATISILAARRTTTEDLWPFTVRGIKIFAAVCPGGDWSTVKTLPPSSDPVADYWAEKGGMLMKTQKEEPEQSFINTAFWALLDLPYWMLPSWETVINPTKPEWIEYKRMLSAKFEQILGEAK